MPHASSHDRATPLTAPPGFTRRRFLASLGLLGGAAAVVPFLPGTRASRPCRVEAGRPLLGTWVRVVACDADERRAQRAVERAFRHEPSDWLAFRGQQLVGVLPLMRTRSLSQHTQLISMPYAVYGGALGHETAAAPSCGS